MDTTQQAKNDWIIQQHGLNPADWEVSGNTIVKKAAAPAPAVAVMPEPEGSATEAFGQSLLRSIPSTAAGGLGAAGGLALAGMVTPQLAAGPAALVTIPLTLGAAYLAAKGASKVQESLETPEYKEKMEKLGQAHPWATTGGAIAAMPVGGFNPNLANVGRALSGAGKIASRVGASPEEMAHLANVGIGSAIGAVQPMVEGNFNPSDIAFGAATGAAFNKPNMIGRKLGFHDVQSREIMNADAVRNALVARIAQEQGKKSDVNVNPGYIPDVSSTITGLPAANTLLTGVPPGGLRGRIPVGVDKDGKPIYRKMLAIPEELHKEIGTAESEILNMEAEGGPARQEVDVPDKYNQDVSKVNPEEVAANEGMGQGQYIPQMQKVQDFYSALEQRAKQIADEQAMLQKQAESEQAIAKAGDLEQQMQQNQIPAGDNVTGKAIISPLSKIERENARESDLTERNIEQTLAGESKFKYQHEGLTPEGKALLEAVHDYNENNGTTIDVNQIPPEYFNMVASGVSKLHGITDILSDSVKDGNKEVLGQAQGHYENGRWVSDKVSKISASRGDAGTQFHENWHHIWSAMSPEEQARMAETVKPQMDAVNADRVKVGKQAYDVEEFLATDMGYSAVKRVLNLADETPLKQWWNDLSSSWKSKYGKEPAVEDLYRANVYKLLNGISGLKRGSITGGVAGAEAAVRNQEEPLHNAGAEREYFTKIKPQIEKPQVEKPTEVPASKETAEEGFKQMYGAVAKNAEEGLTPEQKREQRLVKMRENAAAARERNRQGKAEVRGGQPIENIGQFRQHTADEDRVPLGELTTKRSQIIENEVRKAVGKRILTIRAELMKSRDTTLEFIKKQDLQDITQNALIRLSQTGIDSDGLKRTVWRRTNDAIDEFMKEVKTRPKTTSLDKPIFTGETKTVADRIAAKETGTEDRLATDAELEDLAKQYGEEPKEEPKAPPVQKLPDRRVSAREATKSVRLMLADDLHWKMSENLEMLKEDMESQIEKLDLNPAEAAKMRAVVNGKIEKAEGVLKQLEAEFGNQIDASEWTRRFEGTGKNQGEGLTRGLSPAFDKVKKHSPEVAKALRSFEARKRNLQGLGNAALADLNKFDHKLVDRVFAAHRDAYRNGVTTPPAFTGKSAEISNIIGDYFEKIADIRRAYGVSIHGRTAGKARSYVPDMLNSKTLDLFSKDGNSTEADRLKGIWAQYVNRASGGRVAISDARANIDAYVSALGGDRNNYRSVAFGAIRKAAGYGIPKDLRESAALTAMSKYSTRASADLAMFKELESNDRVAAALLLKNPTTGVVPTVTGVKPINAIQDVKNAMKWVTGGFAGSLSTSAPKVNAIIRVINNALLGPATGVRDIVSVPMNTLPYINKWSDLSAAMKGIAELRKNSRMALETGAKQPNIDRVQFDDIKDSPDKFVLAAGKLATALRKYQGREAIENVSRDITYSMGVQLVRNNLIGAKAGHKASKAFLEKFSDALDGDIMKMTGADLESAIHTMAANFSDRIQGTYGGRGLPTGMVDSPFAPFWSLQKWSVEKSNVIFQDVIRPFITGENRMPFLMYSLGSVLTGAGIQQLNELMSGKKNSDPNIKDVVIQGRPQDYVAQLATLMQLGSYAGIVGDAVKFATDTGIYGKTPRNIISFPTATAALDFQEKTIDMIEALNDGEDAMPIVQAWLTDVMTKNIQAVRMAGNRLDDEKSDRSDKYRDMRVFGMLTGQPNKDFTPANKYLTLGQKGFKRAGTPKEAITTAMPLVRKAMDKNRGNPEGMKKDLESLKRNSYQTMPSPERMPLMFKKYYDYLVRAYGEDVAKERLADYMKQSAINRAKSQLIPSL